MITLELAKLLISSSPVAVPGKNYVSLAGTKQTKLQQNQQILGLVPSVLKVSLHLRVTQALLEVIGSLQKFQAIHPKKWLVLYCKCSGSLI